MITCLTPVSRVCARLISDKRDPKLSALSAGIDFTVCLKSPVTRSSQHHFHSGDQALTLTHFQQVT